VLVLVGCGSVPSTASIADSNQPYPISSPGASIPARPPVSYPPLTDYGSRATVIVERLEVLDFIAVIDYPGAAAQVPISLGNGTEVLLSKGPLSGGGLDWYEVYFGWVPTDAPYFTDVTYGWVAAGPTGQPPTSIHIDPPHCPDTVSPDVVGGMSSLARLECLGTHPQQLRGVLDECSFANLGKPEWQFTECRDLLNLDGTASGLTIFFRRQRDTAGLHVGQVVRVEGHVDDSAASKCRQPSGGFPVEDAAVVLRCRSAFVVSEVEVTG
jgi:hypothetical protein